MIVLAPKSTVLQSPCTARPLGKLGMKTQAQVGRNYWCNPSRYPPSAHHLFLMYILREMPQHNKSTKGKVEENLPPLFTDVAGLHIYVINMLVII